MGKVHAALLALNRGEVSKTALARVDIEKLRLATECQVNWLPSVTGSQMLRPGLQYIGVIRGDNPCALIPFVFGQGDTAIIEITLGSMRVWVSDALVTRGSVSSQVTNGNFSSGTGWTLSATDGCTADINSSVSGALYLAATARGGVVSCTRSVTVAAGDLNDEHSLRIAVTRGPVTFMCGSSAGASDYIARTVLDTGDHSLTFTPTGDFHVKFESQDRRAKIVDSITVEAAGSLDLPSPWLAADFPNIRYRQSGDIIYVACDGYQQRKIERRSTTGWSLVKYESNDGPVSFVETHDITLTPSVYEGNGTLTASAPFFRSTTAVGRMFRLASTGQTRQAILGAQGAVSEALRVSGAGSGDRGFSYVIAGTWVGTIAIERSVDGADRGYKEFATATGNGTTAVNDSTPYDNTVVWYRFNFKTYTSGSATVSFTNGSGGLGGDQPVAAEAGGDAGICRVTSFTSSTVVNIEVLKPFSSIAACKSWMPGDWSEIDGWPTAVDFHEGRLWWFRGDKRWGSVSDNFASFDLDEEGDSGPINRSFGDGPMQQVNWALSLNRLLVGRETSVESIRASANEEPLTPTNNTARSCSSKGAAELPAVKVNGRGVYVEQSGRKVYALQYSVEAGDYVPRDLTRLNIDIGEPAFVSLGVQEQPDTYIHLARDDGEVAVLLYEPNDEVECWTRYMTLGTVENVATLPGTLEDSVYYVVRRVINGTTKRFLEKLAQQNQCVGGTLNRQADCFLSISQASSVTIGGLSHLEGETVVVWANGKDLGTYTVASSAITVSEAVTTAIVGLGGVTFTYDSSTAAASVTALAKYNDYPAEVFADDKYVGTVTVASGLVTLPNGRTAKKITAYLGYRAPFRSSKLAYGAQMGTALSQIKKVEKIGPIMYDTHYQGLTYGSSIHDLQPLPLVERGQDTAAHTVWPEFDGPMIGLAGSWDTDSRLHFLASAPRPCTMAGVVVAVETSESR